MVLLFECDTALNGNFVMLSVSFFNIIQYNNLFIQGKIILDVARQSVYSAGYCPWTGLLLPVEQLEDKSSPSGQLLCFYY